jgi:hypothetical protein
MVGSAAGHAEAQRRRRRHHRRHAPTTATVTVQSTLTGAEVLIDEEIVGVTPLEGPVTVSPGSHTIRVRRPGYTEFTDVVRVRPGEHVDVPVDLMALSMVLTVRSDPDEARVFIDGTFRGSTPIELELIEGEHSIRITHPTHREVVRQVTAVAGRTDVVDVTLEPIPPEELAAAHTPEWYEEPIVWIAVGAGAVVAAVTIVLVAVLTQGGSQINDFCGGAAEQTCIRVMPEWQF